MARTKPSRTPLTADEREGIVLVVNSAFRKLKNLSARIVPVFEDSGLRRYQPASSRGISPNGLHRLASRPND